MHFQIYISNLFSALYLLNWGYILSLKCKKIKITRKRKERREKEKQNNHCNQSITKKGYIKIHGSRLTPPKGNSKFKILLVKIFNLKQRNESDTSTEKSDFISSRKQAIVPSDFYFCVITRSNRKGIAMEKCKAKAIQVDLGFQLFTFSTL